MMLRPRRYGLCLGVCLSVAAAQGQQREAFLENLLGRYPAYFDTVLRNADSLGIQVIYTQIDRNKNNSPSFKDYYFNVDSGRYFYPASTVKLPVALLAMARLHELAGVDRNTTLLTEADQPWETMAINDPTSPDGRPTVGQYVKEIFLTSDNDAFNRLYEWLGPEYINTHLHRMGYGSVQIRHRLEVTLTEDQNRRANPGRFADYTDHTLLSWPSRMDSTMYEPREDRIDGVDFSRKNRISLMDLHRMLRSILFPASVQAGERFDLGTEDYQYLYRCMSELPGETRWPAYDTSEVWNGYVKYLLFGGHKGNIPPSVRVFNKIGEAYGFLLDVAYIMDQDRGVEFMLSAVIRCNPDRRLGDEHYTYEELGFPFLQHLGEVVYRYELQRPRHYRPDLSGFAIIYDK